MNSLDQPPLALQRVAESVAKRLRTAGVAYTIRFMPPTEVNSWRLAVATDDEEEGYVFGSHGIDTIGVIPVSQEDVSVAVATEYVLMSLGLLSEPEWWETFQREKAAERQQRRAARRARWRARLGMR
ncbi:MAG: hypothetical protein QOJ92_2548 [Frankiales bacterium]|nr:hypothetical protein [Frankiales bacterium]